MKQLHIYGIVLLLLGALVLPAAAQDMMDMTPTVEVTDQVSLDGTVTIDRIVSAGPGWLVIHADNGEGAPGPVIGFRQVGPGETLSLPVAIDTTSATSTLFAMLHVDDSEIGTYEFGQVEGADGPVVVDGNVVTPPFTAEIMQAYDQFVNEDTVVMNSVTASQNGFVVVHADSGEGTPGPVIGFAPVEAGTTLQVGVPIEGELTSTVFPMLHVDTGEAGTYEFGEVEGADGPVVVGGQVATFPISTVPAMRVPDQIVLGSEATTAMEMSENPTVIADTVLSDGPGWLVIHADNGEGGPGPVIGFAELQDGLNLDVVAEVEQDGVTPRLFPMMHVDTGEAGTYEFGEVEGADGPVTVDGNVVVYGINAVPSITYEGTIEGNVVTVAQALIDSDGWLVIHADNGEGGPGPVLGFTPIHPGVNSDVSVTLDESGMTDTLFPMLHYDTGEQGVYEFGQVEGADGPVIVDGSVVVGPLALPMMEMEQSG